MPSKKLFCLDTNVVLHDPQAIYQFEEHDVVLPFYVIEELDQFKKEGSDRGRNSREVCRSIRDLVENSNTGLQEGISLGAGRGNLFIPIVNFEAGFYPDPSSHGAMDRAIIRHVIDTQTQNPDREVILVSMDLNMQIRAWSLGLRSETYESKRAKSKISSSVREIESSKDEIAKFFHEGSIETSEECIENESVMLKDPAHISHTALGRYSKGSIQQLKSPREGVMGIKPRNREQAFALDLLVDESIQFVSLVGISGSGKTLLAVAAGLAGVESGKYSRMLVSRPIIPMGRDLGYTPGSIEEKLAPWMQPIFDNLDVLFNNRREAYQSLIDSGKIQIEPLTYIRGRSLPGQYILTDESQNLSVLEAKTIITRLGEGSKLVMTGDPDQIDNPHVDSTSNGLAILADKFRDQAIAGCVVLTRGERSAISELATILLR